MPKVLITGGAGFIGRHTANELIARGFEVRVFDNLTSQVHQSPRTSLSILNPDVEVVVGDMRNREQVSSVLEGVDVIYHFAAETGVGQSMHAIAHYSDVIIQGTAVLCDCITGGKNKISRVILSSSRAVYGEGQYSCNDCGTVYPQPRTAAQLRAGAWDIKCPKCGSTIAYMPCNESVVCRPISIYGIAKRVQEELFQTLSLTYEMPTIILRYFNVVGAGQSAVNPYTGVLSIFCSQLLSNKNIEIYEDGQMQRDFVSVKDVIRANLKALDLDATRPLVLNVGSGIPRTILQVAQYLKATMGSQSEIIVSGRYRMGDIRHSLADTSMAQKLLGESPDDSFEQSIIDLIRWTIHEKGKSGLDLEKAVAELNDHGLTGIANPDAKWGRV
jgi:dTDP-L-rhamnose 4-epimerase